MSVRAACEACGQFQPGNWQAGDLCIHCGQAVRREVRCFWCVRWTPDAKYCRKCGADVIEPHLFGVARMLKDAGTDRFTIPKLIGEFDSGRIGTFRAIYQSHAAVLEAHVADLEYVESFLLQSGWSAELERELLAQLPWPDKKAPVHTTCPGHEDRLAHIAQHSPFVVTQQLACLARLRSGDGSAKDDAIPAVYSQDQRIVDEAALALTHWRIAVTVGTPYEMDRTLEPALLNSRFSDHAAVRLAYKYPRRHELPKHLLASHDPDLAFMAALVTGDETVLEAAAADLTRDELTRYAACDRLATSGPLGLAIANALPALTEDHQLDLLATISRRKTGAPQLERCLLTLAAETEDPRVRQRAILVMCREMSYETAMAVIPYAIQDRDIAADLLRSTMPPEAFAVLGRRLVDARKFTASHWGMDAAAKPGRMPETFVSAVYANVPDTELRGELLRFAENQVDAREGDCAELADFIVERCFSEPAGKAQSTAWSAMSRLRRRESHSATVPFEMEAAAIIRIFGSMDRFLRLLTDLLRQTKWRDDVLIFDPLSRFIRYTEDNVYAAMCGSREVEAFVSSVVGLLEDGNLRGFMRSNAIYPLIGLARACPALRAGIEEHLERFRAEVYELRSESDYALRRIRGELG